MKLNPLDCPHCGRTNDAHACLTDPGAAPGDGDITLCIYCGKFSVYEQGAFRLPTIDEWNDIFNNPDCKRAEATWFALYRERIRTQ